MNKDEFIAKRGEEAYKLRQVWHKQWRKAHLDELKARERKWRDQHPEEVKALTQERGRKGGKYYDKYLEYKQTGLQGERNKIRKKHRRQYLPFKKIIAPDSQIHHEWIPLTSEYRGVALVEATPHQFGIIDVILILDGGITLLTEEEVKRGEKM